MDTESIIKNLSVSIEDNYELLRERIQNRRKNQDKVSFLFSEKNSQPFIPDYFVLNEVGINSFQRFLNHSLSGYAWPLWKKIFLKNITARLLKPVHTIFKPKILSLSSLNKNSSQIVQHWEKRIERQILESSNIIRYATFYEIFLFLTDALSTLIKVLNVNPDLFADEKLAHHNIVLSQYPALKNALTSIENAHQQLALCLFVSSSINQLDLMNRNLSQFVDFFSDFTKNILNAQTQIENRLPLVSYKNLNTFTDFLLKKPLKILFECDNCGEILIDLIFIEILLKSTHEVTVACKEKFILNDVTEVDLLKFLDLPQLSHLKPYLQSGQLKIIHTGSSIPGKYLYEVPRPYQDCYLNSDCLILKGEGNFQTMPAVRLKQNTAQPYSYKKPIFYALSVKTSHITRLIEDVFGVRDFLNKSNIFYLFCEPV